LKQSPFVYGNTVSLSAFTNRENEIKKLSSNLRSGINTMIISPRRWGKSSLVEKVAHELTKKSTYRVVTIDLFTVNSTEAFLELYAREVVKASSNKWEEWVNTAKTFFRSITPKIQLSADPQSDFSLGFDWEELRKHPDEILQLPEAIAQKKELRFIICIDEFQNMAYFDGFQDFERKLRAIWQRHKAVTYCLYGSKRHMMLNIFNSPSKPFYRFGDILLLPKIREEKWVSFICAAFKGTKKNIEKEDAALMCRLMQNHSWYMQQLAHYTWNITHRSAGKNEIKKALEELINSNSPLYQREVEILSTTQLNLLKAIVAGEQQFTAAKVMQDYNLGTPNNVSKNKAILLEKDVIHKEEKGYELLDPSFLIWFEQLYFQRAIDHYFE
jgi:hypothetical protein